MIFIKFLIMDVDKIRALITYDALPIYSKCLGQVKTQVDLENCSLELMKSIASLVFPSSSIELKSDHGI
jgi:hypothetical protein